MYYIIPLKPHDIVPKHFFSCVCFKVSVLLCYGAAFASEELEARVGIVTV